MKKIKIIAGITWALIGLLIILGLFPGLNHLSSSAAKLPFMKINPNFSGGEIVSQMITDNCTLNIRRPVFDGLIKEREKGFVQLDWRGIVPENIDDTIDYNSDGIADFHIAVDRNKLLSDLDPVNPGVTKIVLSTPTSYGWSVRIGLKK